IHHQQHHRHLPGTPYRKYRVRHWYNDTPAAGRRGKRTRATRMFRRLIILTPLLVIAACAFAAFTQYQRWHAAPLPIGVDGELIEVRAGMPLDRLAEQLEDAGIIEHAWDLKLLARLRGDAGRVKAGEYDLEAGLTLNDLLDKLVAG